MSGVQKFEVTDAEDGRRIDRWFKDRFPDLPRSRLEKLLRTGQVRLDGKRVKSSARIVEGQTVRVPPLRDSDSLPKTPEYVSARDREFVRSLVIYEDDAVIALNKPPGLAVQGGSMTERHLDAMLPGLVEEGAERPRLVHRLDKDTSGVLLLAKSGAYAGKLGKSFKGKKARKIYWALCVGVPRPEQGTINLPIAKQAGGQYGERMVPVTDETPELFSEAQKAITHYSVVARAGQQSSWVALMPTTGRTHQLRVHSAAIDHAIVGDRKYGGPDAVLGGEISKQMHLHARSISLPHPRKGQLVVEAPLPNHMVKTWSLLTFEENEGEGAFDELDLDG